MTLSTPYYDDAGVTIHHGDALGVLRQLPDGIVQTCVTSPPYWGLRTYGTATWEGGNADCDHVKDAIRERGADFRERGKRRGYAPGSNFANYGDRNATASDFECVCSKCGAKQVDRQLGLESTPEEFIANMVELFREVRRVLRDDGTCWINMGTSYFGGQSADSRDTSDTALSDCRDDGCPSIHLCDECRGAILTRTGDSDVRRALGLVSCGDGPSLVHTPSRILCVDSLGGVHRIPSELSSLSTHDQQRLQAHAREQLGASLESMTPQSWPPPPDGCWHCGNCGACLSVLGSLSLDAGLCVRKSGDTSGTGLPSDASVRRRSGNSSLGLACGEYSINLPRFKHKDLVPMPWLLGIALIGDGWFLRSEIIWNKNNPMPESCTDRPTKAHETILLLSKRVNYYYDADAVREEATEGGVNWDERKAMGFRGNTTDAIQAGMSIPSFARNSAGRNKRTVWTVSTESFKGAHFATYPRKLIEPCILAGANDRTCAKCGTAWRRIVESERVPTRPGHDTKTDAFRNSARYVEGQSFDNSGKLVIGNRDPLRHVSVRTQKGHEPDCKCGTTETKPSIVLDPFMGSGTTAEVARKHGCHCIGIELNAEYIALAAKRLSQGVLEFSG